MKNRSSAFDCSIAGKTVGIALRHGGGLQEPGKVYVRCDERDCQYVDLNEAPCPLRVDMFADGSDLRVARYLAAQSGQHICYACLTDALGVTHEQVRRATWRLREEIGLVIRPSRCGACKRRRVTIGLPPGAAVRPAEPQSPAPLEPHTPAADASELSAYLSRHAGFFFCAHCLARELKETASSMRESMWSLERDSEFAIRTAQCVSCLLVKRVIRHQPGSDETGGARRLIQFIAQGDGAAYCASCLAFSTDSPLADVRRVVTTLEGVLELHRRDGTCTVCGRWQTVVSMADRTLDSAQGDEIAELASGSVRHRGCRIDLLSFRVTDGWRPLALIKTAMGALQPDAPTIFLGLAPSKFEADELAADAARAWIDKRFP